MERARAATVKAAALDDAHVLCLQLEEDSTLQMDGDSTPSYSYSPSDSLCVNCDWSLPDCYEGKTVECRPSSVMGAGDGLFAIRRLPRGKVVSFYNGVRVMQGQRYSADNLDYQVRD